MEEEQDLLYEYQEEWSLEEEKYWRALDVEDASASRDGDGRPDYDGCR